MTKKKKPPIIKYLKTAQKLSWCDLAYEIICVERQLRDELNPKQLKILDLKLEAFELEKNSRVFSNFNILTIIGREADFFDTDFSE